MEKTFKIKLYCQGREEFILITPLMIKAILEKRQNKPAIADLFTKIILKLVKKGLKYE